MSRFVTVLPRWSNPGPAVDNWREFVLGTKILSDKNSEPSSFSSSIGSLGTGTFKWVGAFTGLSQAVYCCPLNSVNILKINTDNNTVVQLTTPTSRRGWFGCALSNNGFGYFIPSYANQVIKIDTTGLDTVTAIGPDYGAVEDFKWQSAVFAPNGKIYAPPRQRSGVLRIDTTTDTVDEFGTVASGPVAKYLTSYLMPNGLIYCFGGNAQPNYMIIDPSNDTLVEIPLPVGFVPGTAGIGIDGLLYILPRATDSDRRITKFNPADNSFTYWHNVGDVNDSWGGSGVLFPDGRTYFIPNSARYLISIDPVNDLVHEDILDFGTDLNKYVGGSFGYNGKFYCSPSHAESVRVINASSASGLEYNFVRNHWFNRN